MGFFILFAIQAALLASKNSAVNSILCKTHSFAETVNFSHTFVMGGAVSVIPVNPDATESQGHWAADWKTGYRWCTDAITSDPDVQKIPGATPGSEVWGPYIKKYTKSFLGQLLFTPPESVDGVPILCQCRDIPNYMRDSKGRVITGAGGSILFGSHRPACWEDDSHIMNPNGGPKFTVILGHPEFYINLISKNLIGNIVKIAENTRKRARKTRKLRRRN